MKKMFVARGLQTLPGECLLRLDVLPHKETVGRATGGQTHCALRLGLNDWRKKKKPKKPYHLCLLLKRSQKEFDEKDMFRSCDLV